MRQCSNPQCRVALRDNELICPLCGYESVDAGSGKLTKQRYDKTELVGIQRSRHRSCIGTLILVALACVFLAWVYQKLTAPIGEPYSMPGPIQNLINRLTGGH